MAAIELYVMEKKCIISKHIFIFVYILFIYTQLMACGVHGEVGVDVLLLVMALVSGPDLGHATGKK